ncbi:MAG: transposase [Candidatus Thiodiazotropha sp. (ex Monitilora ramsayi)]|nr:transposase [Candidatus Thiodiazotropha sp. (ex Monitilora ramsayi)]
MTRKRKPYKTYTKEFKEEAVRMMESSDRPAAEVAMELGIRRNQLYKWRDQLQQKGGNAFSGQRGRPKKEDQSEVVTLRQENERLKEELEILKKAARTLRRSSSEVRIYPRSHSAIQGITALRGIRGIIQRLL